MKGDKNMEQEKTGKFIAECRKNKKMTQEQLAEKIGVTRKSISRWENGISMPDYSVLDILCKTLNISINELYYGTKLEQENYKDLSEKSLKMYIKEKYTTQLLIKKTIKGFIDFGTKTAHAFKDLNFANILLLFALQLIVPISAGISYLLGYKNISLGERFIYEKK